VPNSELTNRKAANGQAWIFFSAVIFFQFLVIKALDPYWIRIRIGLQPQPLDPDPEKMNTDPKHCCKWAHLDSRLARQKVYQEEGCQTAS
jgi:hypothetical protein